MSLALRHFIGLFNFGLITLLLKLQSVNSNKRFTGVYETFEFVIIDVKITQTTFEILLFCESILTKNDKLQRLIDWEISDRNVDTARYGPKSGVSLIVRES